MTSQRRRAVAGIMVCLCAAAVLAWLVFWKRPLLEVAVTVWPDGGERVEVYSRAISLPQNREHWAVFESEIDLRRWAGRLVRVDVDARVKAAHLVPIRRGDVACSAQLWTGGQPRRLQFAGWHNEGPPELHLGRLGCTQQSVPGSNPPAVYAGRNTLWHVLRVPSTGKAVLGITFRPCGDEAGFAAPHRAPGEAAREFEPASVTAPERPPDVFIYLVDALRADHVSAYGYARKTTPVIEQFASGAVVYERAQTPATWTRPSVASLLTGLSPFVHGAMHRTTDKLQEWPVLLPEVLHAAGYQTAGIVTNTAVNERFGFAQGYDHFQYRYKRSTDWVNARAEEFLADANPEQPVFMYLHIMEAHSPYTPRSDSRKLFDRGFQGTCDGTTEELGAVGRVRPRVSPEDVEHLVDLYDAEVYEVDRGFAEFLDIVKTRGRFNDALFILLADHGEAFNEHRTLEHGNTLNVEEMHVPLVIRYPHGEFAGTRVPERVCLRDVFPTVLSVAGVEADIPYPIGGLNLRPGTANRAASSTRPIYAEVSKHANNHLDLIGVIDPEGYKRVIDMSRPRGVRATEESIGLWDTGTDAAEAVDIRLARPVRAAYCEQLIAQWLTEQRELHDRLSRESISRPEMTEELERELQGLGYVD